MSSEPKVIYTAANAQEAYLLKGLLEDEGIMARVVNDAIQLAGGELPLGWTAAPQVVVKASDAVRAREIAEGFDRGESALALEEPAYSGASAEAWADWPLCPTCGERRSARCPSCGDSGTAFPIADVQTSQGDERVFLVCESCDDHFVPEWYRLCARCGHDYGQGVEPVKTAPVRPNLLRVWFLTVALLAAAIFSLAYFGWLFS